MVNVIDYSHVGPQQYTHTIDARTIKDKWYFKVDDRNADPIAVETAALLIIPAAWASFPTARLRSVECSQLVGTDTHGWEIDVEYSTKAEGDEDNPLDENPLNKPASIDFDFVPYDVVIDKDIQDKPIASTAGEPYDDVTIEDGRWQAVLRWNSATFPLDFANSLKKTVNSDTFLGREPHTLKLAGLRASSQIATITNPQTNQQEELFYYQVEARFDYDDQTWKRKIANRGFYKLNSNGEMERIRDEQGEPIETPRFISEDGTTVLAPGDTPFIQEFEVFTPVAYSSIFPTPQTS